MADFGSIFIQVMRGIIVPFFEINLSIFGLTFSVGSVIAWVTLGSVVIGFINVLGDS